MAMILSSPIDSSSSKTIPTTPENCPPFQNHQETSQKFQYNKQRNHQHQQDFKNQGFTNSTQPNYQDCTHEQNQNQNYPQRGNNNNNNNNNKNPFYQNKNWGFPMNQSKFTNYQQLNDSSASVPSAPRPNPNNSFYPKKNSNIGFVHQSINQLQQSRLENQVNNFPPHPPLPPQQQVPFQEVDSCSEYSSNQYSDDPRMKQPAQQQQQFQQFNKHKQFSKYQSEQSQTFENNNNNNNNNYRHNNKRNIQAINSSNPKDEVQYGQMNKSYEGNNFQTTNNQRKNHFQQPPAPPVQDPQNQCVQGNDAYKSMNLQQMLPSSIPLQNKPTCSNFPQETLKPPPPPSPSKQLLNKPCKTDQASNQQIPSPLPPQEPTKATTAENKCRELSIDKDLLKTILDKVIDDKLEILREEMRSLFQNLSLMASDPISTTSKTSQSEKTFLQNDKLSDLHAEVVAIKNADRQRTRSPNKLQASNIILKTTNVGEASFDGDKKDSVKNKKKKDKKQHEKKENQSWIDNEENF